MNMKGTFVAVIFGFALLAMPANRLAQQAQGEIKVEQPKLLALLFYADWCNSCKVLEPKLDQVKREFQTKSVLFTRFDMTDDFTKDQSAHYAALVGLEKFYGENAGKTGFMLLIETGSKKLLGKITKDKSADEIKSMLTHALMGHPVGG